jgi:hypothetical protein
MHSLLQNSPALQRAVSRAVDRTPGDVANARGAAKGSVYAATVQALARASAQRADETDTAYADRLARAATRVMRHAWYLNASTDQRVAAGLPTTGADYAAMVADHLPIAPWQAAESEQAATPAERDVLAKAAAYHAVAMQAAERREVIDRGLRYGAVDASDSVDPTTGAPRYAYQAGSMFEMVQMQDPDLAADHARAYARARAAVLQDAARQAQLPASPAPGEPDDVFAERREREINRVIFLNPIVVDG